MMGETYEAAGVSIGAGEAAVDAIKADVRSTFRPEVIGDIGGFGGLFRFDPKKYKDPILVSSTDGVGTKLKIAIEANFHDNIGIDLPGGEFAPDTGGADEHEITWRN